MTARFLDFGTTDPLTSQAVYHGLAKAMDESSEPVLDMVRPDAPYVSIGAHQELEKEVDVAFAEDAGLPIYRRHVGGGTVLLDSNQLFWHYVIPRESLSYASTDELFERFLQPAIDTYQQIGVDASYAPVNDLVVGQRKIGGTGAGEIGDATMLVGSFMLDFDVETMAKVVRPPSEKFQDKMYETLQQSMTTIAEQLDEVPPVEEIQAIFRDAVEDRLDWDLRDDEPTEAEERAIDEAREELADPDWLRRRGLASSRSRTKIKGDTHLSEGRYKATGGLIRATVVEKEGVLDDLLLSGDIQVLPETGLEDLAVDLVGRPLEREALVEATGESIERRDVELPGVEPDDVAAAILAAVEQAD